MPREDRGYLARAQALALAAGLIAAAAMLLTLLVTHEEIVFEQTPQVNVETACLRPEV